MTQFQDVLRQRERERRREREREREGGDGDADGEIGCVATLVRSGTLHPLSKLALRLSRERTTFITYSSIGTCGCLNVGPSGCANSLSSTRKFQRCFSIRFRVAALGSNWLQPFSERPTSAPAPGGRPRICEASCGGWSMWRPRVAKMAGTQRLVLISAVMHF